MDRHCAASHNARISRASKRVPKWERAINKIIAARQRVVNTLEWLFIVKSTQAKKKTIGIAASFFKKSPVKKYS